MKKTLSLLLALVMVISLFPGFADERPTLTAEEAGSVLKGYGAIKGDSKGDLMIDKELKRQDAVVILTRLMGKEADAMATTAMPSFEDITIDYYKPFLAFAEANKWVEGKAEKKFGFNDVVTVKEFTAMLLRALGHDTMGDNYAKVMDLAKEQGLLQGVMAEEAAPVIRGVAFIMMNNTLETTPKGEKQALVYKLGYKEVPKPENLTVISAEAQGLKAIDVKFSKAVSEKSLKGISVKDGSKKVTFEPALVDEMTARLVLNTVAKQDAKYMVTVDGVKSADMTETVEKFEAAVFMTDATRPEVMSVEALNPKTLLVKVSEPIDKDVKSFATLKEFKIADKALVGKVTSDLEKNEMIVELYTALKAGDYKLEVSGLKDFAGFVAKTQEFDITVVEDKDAPVVTEATMINLNTVKVVFNEPLSQKGQFRVDGKNVTPASSIVLGKDKKTVTLTLAAGNELGMGAITEVKVEHKGQRDIMGNEVKDWTKFTFKVQDDTTLPEVKSVEVDGTKILVTFTKNMNTAKGFYTLKKGDKVVIAKTSANGKFNKDDAAVLEIEAATALNNANASAYTLVLEGFVDGTVRKNEMAKVEHAIEGGDTKAPTVEKKYSVENLNDATKNLKIKIFFSEEMDSATLLDKKNFTFSSYVYKDEAAKTNLRADAVDSKLDFSLEQDGKILIIEANDVKVMTVTDITMVGLKDKAGNQLGTQTVAPWASVAQTNTVEFIKDGDVYVLKMTFGQPIEYMGEAFKLTAGAANLNLKHRNQSADNLTHYFDFDQTDVTADAKKGTDALTLALVDGKLAKSVYGEEAVANTVVDKVAPSVVMNSDNTPKIEVDTTDYDKVKVYFDEKINNTEADQKISLATNDGIFVATTVSNVDDVKYIEFQLAGASQFENGTYKLTLVNISDQAATPNVATDLGTFNFKVEAPTATLKEIKTLANASKDVILGLVSDLNKAAYGPKPGGGNYAENDVKGDFVVTVNGTPRAVDSIDLSTAGEIKLTLTGANLNSGEKIVVKFVSGKLVDDVNKSVIVPDATLAEKLVP